MRLSVAIMKKSPYELIDKSIASIPVSNQLLIGHISNEETK